MQWSGLVFFELTAELLNNRDLAFLVCQGYLDGRLKMQQ
jgi:hypothetical protein